MRFLIMSLIFVLCLGFAACGRTQKNVAVVPGAQCQLPETSMLDTPLKPQETDQWCWAASGQMIMAFHNHDVSQCLQANNEFQRNDCCVDSKPSACVRGGWPEFAKYDFDSERLFGTHLNWDQLREQIACKKTPVAFSWRWLIGGGHMMVVRGYTTSQGVKTLFINNPWPPLPEGAGEQQIISYDEYIAGTDHTHWDDFYNIKFR